MNGWTKDSIINILKDNVLQIHNCAEEFENASKASAKETLDYLQNLIEQIPNAVIGPLIPKTPKVLRKKDIKRPQTIPEDDVVENERKHSGTLVEDIRIDEPACDEIPAPRAKRAASQRAARSIKAQQNLQLGTKLRRPSVDDDAQMVEIPKVSRASRAKRTLSVAESSDEDIKRPTKSRKIKQKSVETSVRLVTPKVEPDETYTRSFDKDETIRNSKEHATRNKRQREKSSATLIRRNSRSEGGMREPVAKRANIEDDTMEVPETDMTVESSLYEDAVGKSIPMNSTMNANTTVTFDRKMMNVTVVLEAMQLPGKVNETVTIQRSTSDRNSRRDTTTNEEPSAYKVVPGSPRGPASVLQTKISLQDKMKALKETLANQEFDALITEDESSPELEDVVKTKQLKNKSRDKETKRTTRSSLLSEEDDVFDVTITPPKKLFRDVNGPKSMKNSYKPNALFSPYSKESVKKRVEAFEQAGLNSPQTIEIDAPARLTRTKTRAMTAAASQTPIGPTAAQKATRKSLARAKQIALTRERKEHDEGKENNDLNSAKKPSRLLAPNDKLIQKAQSRTTPVGKSRLQMPMSVNRIHHTPAGPQTVNQNKALTASRANIVTSVESFLAPAKIMAKSTSNDNLAEKKRKVNDEDVRRKREETLKAMSEEKRRKREEKELKNKLAREAKEKLDMEKRMKQEKEREEKAKAALILQERQREESERKKLLQLQRAQEKEERRKQEEQIRLQRLQEQEEAERQLAEQKRREQEAERRKLAEARAQQIAASEAARLKAHYIAKAKYANNKNQKYPTSYVLDSEPDEDESDDESKPKHVIPYWAQPSIRAHQLAIQEHIPMSVVLTFFGAKKCTPDLTDLFTGIKKERLQRTSSAIWKTPPRYSMMTSE